MTAMSAGADDPDWLAPPSEAAYAGLAGGIVRSLDGRTEADPVALLGTFLAIFGTLVGGRRALHQGTWQKANIFVAIVGDTSDARKGTGLANISSVFDEARPGWNDELIVPGIGSGEGLLTRLKEAPRALILESEMTRLLTVMAREGSTAGPMIRNAWDGVPLGRYVANAKQSGTVLEHHVGFIGHITRTDLEKRLTSTDAANGFGNRFLWLASRRQGKVPFTEPVRGLVSEALFRRLNRAVAFASQAGTMHWSPEARIGWAKFYTERQPRYGLVGALTARADAYVARLALIYALLDATDEISMGHLNAALAVWDYADRSAVFIFGDSTGSRWADALLREIGSADGAIPWEELKRSLYISAPDLESAVGLLTRQGHIRVVEVRRPGGGRPRREVRRIHRMSKQC